MSAHDWPARMPGAAPEIPIEVRRYLTMRLLEKQLEIQGGWDGVVAWLYRGSPAREGVPRRAMTARGHEFWPEVLADTEDWLAKRAGGVAA